MNLKGWKFTLDFQIYECSQIYALKDIWRKSVSQEVFLGNNFMISDEGMSLLLLKILQDYFSQSLFTLISSAEAVFMDDKCVKIQTSW